MSTTAVAAYDEYIDSASFTQFADNANANTVLQYMYRDGANWKQLGRTVFSGRITREDVVAIVDALHDGEWFIPGQIGLEDLQEGWDPQYDHPFHSICCFELTLESANDGEIGDFVKAFTTVKWKKRYRP